MRAHPKFKDLNYSIENSKKKNISEAVSATKSRCGLIIATQTQNLFKSYQFSKLWVIYETTYLKKTAGTDLK